MPLPSVVLLPAKAMIVPSSLMPGSPTAEKLAGVAMPCPAPVAGKARIACPLAGEGLTTVQPLSPVMERNAPEMAPTERIEPAGLRYSSVPVPPGKAKKETGPALAGDG